MSSTLKQSKEEIGKRIRELRISLGMSQEELAKAVGYKSNNSRSTINKVEMGYNDIVQSKLPAYARALNVTVSYLLGVEQYNLFDSEHNPNGEVQIESNTFNAVRQSFGKDAVIILQLFDKLNASGKKKALENLEDLTAIDKYAQPEKIHTIKKAARNGSFEEKTITDSELDKIKNLPDVDDLK